MSSVYSIQNSEIYLEVDALGAEWKRLLAFKKQSSCLWSAKKEIWPRHAPILFPIIGKLQQASYTFEGHQYVLSPHGFARDSIFNVIEISESHIKFSLGSSSLTKTQYPFNFQLEISYSLVQNALVSSYSVGNLDKDRTLPFSIGAHPGFSYDWLSMGHSWENVVIEFEQEEDETHLLNKDGLLDISLPPEMLLGNRKLFLKPGIFDKDALILSPVKSKAVDMFVPGDSRRIRMHFGGALAFGLWSKKVDEFVCLEPWWGIPDVVGHNGQLSDKKGLVWLEPGKSHEVSWKTEFINVDKG